MELSKAQIARLFGLRKAATLLRGRDGKPLSEATARNYANPAKGYKPIGWNGPPLVLKTVVMGQDRCTLIEWVEEFEAAKARMGLEAAAIPTVSNRSATECPLLTT